MLGNRYWITGGKKEEFTADWRPYASTGQRWAGRDWKPRALHHYGSRGCGSYGVRYSRHQSNTPSWLQSWCHVPCRRKPCRCMISWRCLTDKTKMDAWGQQTSTVKLLCDNRLLVFACALNCLPNPHSVWLSTPRIRSNLKRWRKGVETLMYVEFYYWPFVSLETWG